MLSSAEYIVRQGICRFYSVHSIHTITCFLSQWTNWYRYHAVVDSNNPLRRLLATISYTNTVDDAIHSLSIRGCPISISRDYIWVEVGFENCRILKASHLHFPTLPLLPWARLKNLYLYFMGSRYPNLWLTLINIVPLLLSSVSFFKTQLGPLFSLALCLSLDLDLSPETSHSLF